MLNKPPLEAIHMKCQDLFSLKKKKKNRVLSATNFAGHFRVKSESEIIQSQGQREWKSSKVLDKLVCLPSAC